MNYVLALLVAVATAVLSAVAVALAASGLGPGSAWLCMLLGAMVGLGALYTTRHQPRGPWKVDPFGSLTIIAFALFALRSFLWLTFESGTDLWVFSPNNLGDLALHITYVRYFANGAPFWPENPIFAGEPLTYPVGMDLFNGLLTLVGVNEIRGFIFVGLIGSACTLAALWRWGRGFVVAGFLFAGGAFGFAVFDRLELVDYQSDAAWEGITVAWKSLPLALFVTQRGLLYALPAGLMLLASWRGRFLEPEKAAQKMPIWCEWLLYASMPVFHLHTFLFLSVVAAWWFLALPSCRRHLGALVALAVIPATAQVWLITGGFKASSMLALLPGWMQPRLEDGMPIAQWLWLAVKFWFLNFGILLPLVVWLVVRVTRRGGPVPAVLLTFPALAVFLVCCFVKFAPWEWDNTKLMIWAYLLILPALWSEILARQNEAVRGLLCFLLFFSGAVSLAGGLTGHLVTGDAASRAAENKPTIGYPLANRADIMGVGWATRELSIRDRFVAHPTYNHPLLLSGRILTMGYEGHAWSHGIDYRDRLATVKSILQGEAGWRQNAQHLGARWLFWGSEEAANYPDSAQPWKTECEVYAEGTWGTIYDLSTAAPPGRPEQ